MISKRIEHLYGITWKLQDFKYIKSNKFSGPFYYSYLVKDQFTYEIYNITHRLYGIADSSPFWCVNEKLLSNFKKGSL